LARPWRLDGDALILSIRLTPRSSKAQLGGTWQDAQGAEWLCASVRAVPEKGKANAALIALLAKTFEVPSGAISLEAGDTSRLKRVRIAGHGVTVAGKLKSLAGEV
jgi:uncharacterized protein YggU (UPF0235/DUF167 family)